MTGSSKGPTRIVPHVTGANPPSLVGAVSGVERVEKYQQDFFPVSRSTGVFLVATNPESPEGFVILRRPESLKDGMAPESLAMGAATTQEHRVTTVQRDFFPVSCSRGVVADSKPTVDGAGRQTGFEIHRPTPAV